jgi:spermidine synthase
MNSSTPTLPQLRFSDHEGVRYLHFGNGILQGAMEIDRPFDLHFEYVQRMMAWLLFVEPSTVPRRHAMQFGLGAAALTKFCWNKLEMSTTAIELNPRMIAACRVWFALPEDDDRLFVLHADAAEVAAHEHFRGQIDALQVDAYDHESAAPALDSEAFYADCRRLLTNDGCMAVNLYGTSSNYAESLRRITSVFGTDCVWAFPPIPAGNIIVLALRRAGHPTPDELARRADIIESCWGLPARSWLDVLAPAEVQGA